MTSTDVVQHFTTPITWNVRVSTAITIVTVCITRCVRTAVPRWRSWQRRNNVDIRVQLNSEKKFSIVLQMPLLYSSKPFSHNYTNSKCVLQSDTTLNDPSIYLHSNKPYMSSALYEHNPQLVTQTVDTHGGRATASLCELGLTYMYYDTKKSEKHRHTYI